MIPDRDRLAWLQERRAAVVAEYDAEAEGYDDHPYPATSHATFVRRLLETCPVGGVVLDAPCGTGQYFELVRASGRQVVGIDQSAGMLLKPDLLESHRALPRPGLDEHAG